MSLGNLLAGLEAEAASETARLEAETREEADRIVEAAQAEARALDEQAVRAAQGEAHQEAEQQRAQARLDAAALLRGTREEMFQAFLAEVHTRLTSLRADDDYPAVLRALIRECLDAVPNATVLRVDPRDEQLAGRLLRELDTDLEIAATLATVGGVEAVSCDGRTARNTIEERLANAEPPLRLLFADRLAGRIPVRPDSGNGR